MSMPTAEHSLGTDTAIRVPTALTRSARAIGLTVTHATLAEAKAWNTITHRVTNIFHTHNGHHSLDLPVLGILSPLGMLKVYPNSYTRIP